MQSPESSNEAMMNNSSSGSSTVTMSTAAHSLSNSEYLSSSQSSLGPSKKASSEISKTYKEASQLFLTRRLSEALSVLQPVITPPTQTNSDANGDEDASSLAPIATATQSQRIKVWSLYVTLMNSIVDLGDDEGRRDFGQKEYKALVAQVRDGEIWEQVVRDGYNGREGSVDAEVVYNLYVPLS
jgi:sodium/bile acid cotransporter 7